MPYRIVDKLKTEGKSDDEVKSFKTGATTFVKKVLDDFKEFQFYTGKRLVPVFVELARRGCASWRLLRDMTLNITLTLLL